MARKSSQSAGAGSVREKAQAMRLEQEHADRRIRNIIIAVVATIVVAVSGVVAYVVATSDEVAVDGVVSPEAAAELLGDYKDGAPIVVSHKGFGVVDESIPTLTEYFDYSCRYCADASVNLNAALHQAVQDGKFNIKYQPVPTANMPYNAMATSASLVIAQKAPDQWMQFHDAAMAYFQSQYNAGQGKVINNARASLKQVKEIATNVGVPQDVVDLIKGDISTDYLMKAREAWGAAPVEGRRVGADGKPSYGTPEFVANGKKYIELTTVSDVDAFMADITEALQ